MKETKKIALAGIIGNPVKSLSSHNGGWTIAIKNILEEKFDTNIEIVTHKDDWQNYDMIILTEGVNYKEGSFNFFGGVQDSQIEKLEKLSNYKGEVYSVSGKLDYNIVMNKRKELSDYDFVFEIPEEIDILDNCSKLVLGDSHSISVFKPGYSINRNDGKTLHGFLKNGIKNYIRSSVEDLIFYAGNIDIRFHACRFGIESIDKNILELETQLKGLSLKKISLVELLPIENESRKIPGTGLYNGKPFHGSREDRQRLVLHFNSMLNLIADRNGWEILKWNFDYSEELPFDKMEARQSVHLRPTSYMFYNELTNEQSLKLF